MVIFGIIGVIVGFRKSERGLLFVCFQSFFPSSHTFEGQVIKL